MANNWASRGYEGLVNKKKSRERRRTELPGDSERRNVNTMCWKTATTHGTV